ncbi:hypothetical protein K1T71_001200 [Dendrolimus kikuchii]|uniref:Uncharacterized protein n=1 Tax=Dendrolimus kikuchii TaxID=765133 RepID=A0ACC1DGY3_9NEOP|nr:hypothetical protein K1T71_001200 [Dendrolimus kikuchii]
MSVNMFVIIPIFFVHITFVITAPQPSQKCSLSDSACIKAAAQPMVSVLAAGIPELGTEVLDVMHVDRIKVDLAGLKLNIRDADIKGLKHTVIDEISVDMAKKQIHMIIHANMNLKAKYKAAGRLLILPISGEGDTTIKLKNLEIRMNVPFELTKNANGKDVIDLKSYKYTYDVKDNAHFHLTNLFNGNKELSDTLHTFMNENWKALTQEFAVPVLEQPLNKIFSTMKTYLKSQPLEDIAVV